MMIIPALLLGIVVALSRRSPLRVEDGMQEDAPLRLLRWTVGLLSVSRAEWGQAMLGELASIEGRGRRWRFTIGCVGATLLLPPWGRAGAGVLAFVATAIGGIGLYGSVVIRYGLGPVAWVWAAIVLVFLLALVLAAVSLLRRPGVAAPGLVAGLFIALAWMVMYGFGFVRFLTSVLPPWAVPLLHFVVPAAVGVVGTLWGGSAVAGRRTSRLAAISASLGLFLYGTLAVAVVGAGGPPDDSGFTIRYIVSDRLGNVVVFYLVLLPLVTATIGWAAAAATTRLRPQLATPGASVGSTALVQGPHRPGRLVLQYAGVAATVLLAAAALLRA